MLVLRTVSNYHLGGSAAAAGQLVESLGGSLLGYLFILEIDFLKGRDKLNAPVHTLLRDDFKVAES
jgi:adenine phosphoribosyltransferase